MFKKALAFAGICVAALGANAQTANFTVTGTVTPAACGISLSNAGVINYGTLTATSVLAIAPTSGFHQLPAQTVDLTVNCSAPTKIAIATTDNRATSRHPSLDSFTFYGLGTVNGANIGGFNIDMVNGPGGGLKIKTTTAGTAVTPSGYPVFQGVATASSTFMGHAWYPNFMPNFTMAFNTTSGSLVPADLAQIAGSLQIRPWISSQVVSSATSNINLSGNATISLVYL